MAGHSNSESLIMPEVSSICNLSSCRMSNRSRRTRRNLLRCLCACLQHDTRKATTEDDAQLSTTQCLLSHTWDDHTLVRLVGLQWWKCFWCELEGRDGMLEFVSNGYVRGYYLGGIGLPSLKKVVDGRLGKPSLKSELSRNLLTFPSAQAASPAWSQLLPPQGLSHPGPP
jgi:hypothetical protein